MHNVPPTANTTVDIDQDTSLSMLCLYILLIWNTLQIYRSQISQQCVKIADDSTQFNENIYQPNASIYVCMSMYVVRCCRCDIALFKDVYSECVEYVYNMWCKSRTIVKSISSGGRRRATFNSQKEHLFENSRMV